MDTEPDLNSQNCLFSFGCLISALPVASLYNNSDEL